MTEQDTMAPPKSFEQFEIEEYTIDQEPYYLPIQDEVEVFTAAYQEKIPVILKGPTGCGKTRFIEYMAWLLGRPVATVRHGSNGDVTHGKALVTIAAHEDLTASDLVGRFLLEGDETKWIDGPLTRAVKVGAICYLDEVVEARKDTTVLIHPLTDHRRLLPVEKRGQVLEAADGFLLVISYNPGYQSALKDLKQSTRQRFVAMEFTYPPREAEAQIVQSESGVEPEMADLLARLGEKVRNLKEHGLQEGVSTRLLIYAGKMISRGLAPRRACDVAIADALTDDPSVQRSIREISTSIFE